MRLCVIGTGYVGLITAVGFAKLGHMVECVDIDSSKVQTINAGATPIYEDKLEDLLKGVIGKNLVATTEYAHAIRGSQFIFLAVGTPSRPDGSIDLSYLHKAAEQVFECLGEYATLVVKSTVVPGTTESLIALASKKGKVVGKDFGLCMNPEFLREGKAIDDFFAPDRIVIGAYDSKSYEALHSLYASFKCPIIKTNLATAEMIKYASNSFLATKLSFMNEVGNLSKRFGIDVYQVLEGMKYDKRIGGIFMNAGVGFGGSCFPKDVSALAAKAKEVGVPMRVLDAVLAVNYDQPLKMVELAKKHFSLKGKQLAVLGIAFKPDTDDIRESPALKIIPALLHEGAQVTVYDPKALGNAKSFFKSAITYAPSARDALKGAHACFILTEWNEFKDEKIYPKECLVVDGRNVIRRKENYEGICW